MEVGVSGVLGLPVLKPVAEGKESERDPVQIHLLFMEGKVVEHNITNPRSVLWKNVQVRAKFLFSYLSVFMRMVLHSWQHSYDNIYVFCFGLFGPSFDSTREELDS